MPAPFIFIATNRLKPGAYEAERHRVPGLVDFIEAGEPRVLAFNEYINADRTEVTVVQVHPDAASMEFHIGMIGERAANAYAETLDATTQIQVFGTPSDSLVETLRMQAGARRAAQRSPSTSEDSPGSVTDAGCQDPASPSGGVVAASRKAVRAPVQRRLQRLDRLHHLREEQTAVQGRERGQRERAWVRVRMQRPESRIRWRPASRYPRQRSMCSASSVARSGSFLINSAVSAPIGQPQCGCEP